MKQSAHRKFGGRAEVPLRGLLHDQWQATHEKEEPPGLAGISGFQAGDRRDGLLPWI